MYKIPLRGWSNGDPTSTPVQASECSHPDSPAPSRGPVGESAASPGEPAGPSPPAPGGLGKPGRPGRPHCLASGSNEPPRASVAEVRTAVLRPNSRLARNPPTPSGPTPTVGRPPD